ncbi:DUF2695 domain-containing protein [Flavisolibacter tropicus]|uniref:DUF2695 domain-containing protein n=1 Tax=Flavisolibacter tropicus TaxID=1492898 RepID=A0A172TXK1_9BACT|nr:DUF2695 domain-containing protein [Flavisolibacter tropicus]ANE51819.1 hypothetical protein SY85_16305 [Flavisolibacter tropicus]
MPDKNEKERRKQLLNDLSKKAEEEFENSLPMSRDHFKKLFDYLDTELIDKGCDDTNCLTKSFLDKIGAANTDEILEWLADKGGYCDCEILANVEEQFE